MSTSVSEAAPAPVALDADTSRQLYTLMKKINATENEILRSLTSGRFRSPFYPVRGLEPACAALGVALRDEDYMVTTYRCIGDVVAKGVSLREIAAELFGRQEGMSKGKGGAMHMSDPSRGLMATTGVVGAGLPIATGLGLAAKLQSSGRVTATTFGDGSTSIGAFHESLNLAAAWDLPIVFLCQNNQWGEHTHIENYTRNPVLADRARALGIRAVRVDGFDTAAVYAAVQEAVETARAEGVPTFVESVTYRLRPHAFGTDEPYIPEQDRKDALDREPVPAFRQQIIADGVLGEGEADEIDAAIAAEVEDAFTYADTAEPTRPDEMLKDVFANDQEQISS